MKKIQRISQFFKWIFILAFIGFPILSIVAWMQAPWSVTLGGHVSLITSIPASLNPDLPLTSSTKVMGFIIGLIPLSIKLFVLYFLIRLFQLYQRFDIFSLRSVNYIKYIGVTLFVGQLLNPIYEGLLSLALTWQNPPGQRIVQFAFTNKNISVLLAALLIILISWVMAEGHKLKEEQEYTV